MELPEQAYIQGADDAEGVACAPDSRRYLMRLVGVIRHGKYEFFAESDREQWAELEALPSRESDLVMSDEVVEVLRTLRETLAPELYKRVVAEMERGMM